MAAGWNRITEAGRWLWDHPRILLGIASVIVIWRVIALGYLTYGDIPYFDVASSKVNFLYAWGSEQLGAPVRQSFNTVRDAGLLLISPASIVYYLLKYVLPLLIIPQLYYWIFTRLGLRSKPVLLLGALFPLFTPIVFGDFLTGQTFWIYLTLPMVMFYTIKIFALQQFTLRNDVLLALWLFFSLGMLPPIVVPLLAIVAIFAGTMALVHTNHSARWIIFRYALSGLRIGALFGLLALPYLLVASSGQAAYTSPSLLGDYYHNYADTNLLNTLRMAGNNGSGQSTLGYNEWSLTNLVGYGIAAVMFGGGVVIGLRARLSRYWIVIIGLLTVLLFVLGFMQLLTINTLFGIRVFESQWIVSTIRNPSKLYAIVLPIFVLLFTFGVGNLLQRYGKTPRHRQLILGGIIVMMMVYGWPALRGDLGLLNGREEALSSYRQDPVVQQIARTPAAQTGRALLLPANHRDELNYQFLNPNFNLLRLEGSLPDSSKMVDAMNDTLNDQNPYFFRYIDALGVSTIFVKKDDTAYKQALFDLFSVRLTPGQTYNFLSSRLPLAHETGEYWEFRNKTASDVVYSPTRLTTIEDTKDAQNDTPFYGHNTAVVTDATDSQKDKSTRYQAFGSLSHGQEIKKGTAQLHDPSLIVADMYRTDTEIVIDVMNPLTGQLERTVRAPRLPETSVLSLEDARYVLTPQKQRVTLRAGEYRALESRLETIMLATDPSFENTSQWKAGDASPHSDGQAAIEATSSSDATAGGRSLQLSSRAHKAFVNLSLPSQNAEDEYVIQFDYKNVRGNAASFGIYQGKESLLPAEGGLNRSTSWTTQTVFFRPSESSKDPINLFYYSEGTSGAPSENRIDNVRFYRVAEGDVVPLSIASYPPDYPLDGYRSPSVGNELFGQNLLTNASFESKQLWGAVGDATSGDKGKPNIQASQTPDKSEGRAALELRSRNHTAYVARRVTRFVPNAVYKLSFDYKHVAGRAPSFAVWQDGAAISRPSGELKSGQGWMHYESYFVPESQASNLTVYFYSRSNGEQTINLYDNVRLETTSLVSTYLSEEAVADRGPDSIVKSYQRLSPTTVQVQAVAGEGLVVLNESFHQGWRAYIVPSKNLKMGVAERTMLQGPGTSIITHQTVNGFANAWWVKSGDYPELAGKQEYTIVLRYEPQKFLYGGLAVMTVTLIGLAVYLSIDSWRGRRDDVSQ